MDPDNNRVTGPLSSSHIWPDNLLIPAHPVSKSSTRLINSSLIESQETDNIMPVDGSAVHTEGQEQENRKHRQHLS